MKFVDDETVTKQLYPFTLTRAVADIRIGILTIREKWRLVIHNDEDITVPSNLLPSPGNIKKIRSGTGEDLTDAGISLQHPWDIFQHNESALINDFNLLTLGRESYPVSASNRVISPENVFLEDGAIVEHCILNASTGPIYVGKNALIMEGSTIRGPFALCEGGVVKMGSKIYGATTIGPFSVAGGEIKNSVIFGYSNKAHDGYLGDSVIGEWCNLGAGTSNSNLKNNASEIKMKINIDGEIVSPGLKCGLLMGDYSRSAINTSFNTGTVTGVCCNIFGEGLTPSFIPSFSWGVKSNMRYEWTKALRDMQNWKRLKNQLLRDEEIQTLKYIFEHH